MGVPLGEGAHHRGDRAAFRDGVLEVPGPPPGEGVGHRLARVVAVQNVQNAVSMVREIGVDANPATIAALIGSGDPIPELGRRAAVEAEISLA